LYRRQIPVVDAAVVIAAVVVAAVVVAAIVVVIVAAIVVAAVIVTAVVVAAVVVATIVVTAVVVAAGFLPDLLLPDLQVVGEPLLPDLPEGGEYNSVSTGASIPPKETERERSGDIDISSTRARTRLPSLHLLKIPWAPTVSVAIAAKRMKNATLIVVWMGLLRGGGMMLAKERNCGKRHGSCDERSRSREM
jgi:hypothetical protein